MQRVLKVLLGVIVIFMWGCSESASTSTSSGGSGGGTTSAFAENITEITVSGNSATVTFDSLQNSDDVVVVVFAYNESETTETFQISASGSSSSLAFATNASDLELSEDEYEQDYEEDSFDLTQSFHQQLRNLEQDLDLNDIAEDSNMAYSYVVDASIVGDQDTFFVLDSLSNSSSYSTVTAELRVQNSYFNFYVDIRDAAAITDAELQELASDFTEVVEIQQQLIGTESDVNGDGRFDVLFTRVVNGLGGSSGIVTGFFFARDLFNVSNSNQKEIFYVHVPDPSGSLGSTISKSFFLSNLGPSVLPHEYQHMISYNQHVFVNGGSSENSWLNEGMSHLQEDVYSANSNNFFESVGIENASRVDGYLDDISSTCFSCGSSLDERGGSYLFLRYLYEQAQLGNFSQVASGAALLDNLIDTTNTGITNVARAVYGSSATETDFKRLLGLFGLATYFSNTGLTTDDQLGFTGINLQSLQNDNRGTVLAGPAEETATSLPYTSSVLGSAINYIRISGSVINNSGGSLDLTFSSDASFGAYVIIE